MMMGEKLFDVRKKLGITQKKMGGGIVSGSTLSRIERNKNSIVVNDLMKILVKQKISVIEFLQEYSEVDVGVKHYQRLAVRFFEEKNLKGLEQLKHNFPHKSGILYYLIYDMALASQSKRVNYEDQVYKLLSKFDEYNQPLLWCLLVSVKLYSEKDWGLLIDKAIEKNY